jgi:hypothetical protein
LHKLGTDFRSKWHQSQRHSSDAAWRQRPPFVANGAARRAAAPGCPPARVQAVILLVQHRPCVPAPPRTTCATARRRPAAHSDLRRAPSPPRCWRGRPGAPAQAPSLRWRIRTGPPHEGLRGSRRPQPPRGCAPHAGDAECVLRAQSSHVHLDTPDNGPRRPRDRHPRRSRRPAHCAARCIGAPGPRRRRHRAAVAAAAAATEASTAGGGDGIYAAAVAPTLACSLLPR